MGSTTNIFGCPRGEGLPIEPTPLSLATVMEGRIVAASPHAEVFNLPMELLDMITRCLHVKDLASLALVCSFSRQMARSRQFSRVIFDNQYVHTTPCLQHLAGETVAVLLNRVHC